MSRATLALLLAFAAAPAAGPAAAATCEDVMGADPARRAAVCGAEAALPFRVRERYVGDPVFFLAWRQPVEGVVRVKTGRAFDAGGHPFETATAAGRALGRIAGRTRCDVTDSRFLPGRSLDFTLACPFGG